VSDAIDRRSELAGRGPRHGGVIIPLVRRPLAGEASRAGVSGGGPSGDLVGASALLCDNAVDRTHN
jgi:hypothetical protein